MKCFTTDGNPAVGYIEATDSNVLWLVCEEHFQQGIEYGFINKKRVR
jgi:hypothetical protein